MTELNIIDDKENNNNFHLKKYFYQLVMINNQDIFNVEEEIKLRFSVDYTKCISINLIS